MIPSEIQFAVRPRTVYEEMLQKMIDSCCGECPRWYQNWAMLLSSRAEGSVHAHTFLEVSCAQFDDLIERCKAGMTEGQDLERVCRTLSQNWRLDFRRTREPAPAMWGELRRHFGGTR